MNIDPYMLQAIMSAQINTFMWWHRFMTGAPTTAPTLESYLAAVRKG